MHEETKPIHVLPSARRRTVATDIKQTGHTVLRILWKCPWCNAEIESLANADVRQDLFDCPDCNRTALVIV